MRILDRLRGRQKAPQGAAGSDATSALAQAIDAVNAGGPDVNPLLSGRLKYAVYEEMRRTDPAVRALLMMHKLPIRAGAWSVEPAGDGKEPLDRLVADACRWQLGLEGRDGPMSDSADESLMQALLCLDFGCMHEELLWSPDLVAWRDADSDEHVVRPIIRLAPRFPATIKRIDVDPLTGRIRRLEQDLPNTSPIPGEKLASYCPDREGNSWWGTSLLRAAWGAWRLKKGMMIAAGIGWDRYAAGIPIVRRPSGGGPEAERKAKEIGRSLRQHERAYVTLEGPKPQPGVDGWDIDLLSGAGTLADPVPLLRWWDSQIAAAGLQFFTSLGTSDRGSRAVGEVLIDPYFQGIEAIAQHIALQRQRQVLRRFVDVNFGTHVDTPRVKVSRIQARNADRIAEILERLHGAGFYFDDVELQNDLRDLLSLPRLPENFERPAQRAPAREGDPLDVEDE